MARNCGARDASGRRSEVCLGREPSRELQEASSADGVLATAATAGLESQSAMGAGLD